jgi:hypothetical protein
VRRQLVSARLGPLAARPGPRLPWLDLRRCQPRRPGGQVRLSD